MILPVTIILMPWLMIIVVSTLKKIMTVMVIVQQVKTVQVNAVAQQNWMNAVYVMVVMPMI